MVLLMKCKVLVNFPVHWSSSNANCRVLNAGKEGKIGTYIVFPPALYGRSIGPVKALGVIQLLMLQQA